MIFDRLILKMIFMDAVSIYRHANLTITKGI